MRKWSSIIVVFAMGLLGSVSSAKADTVATIGTQHFTDGTKITTGAFNTAVAGQQAPFNIFCGSDISSNCFASWTFTYLLPGGDTITGATLTLGIYDIDSAAAGNQVGVFTLNGGDLTSQMNAVSEAANSANSFYNVLSLTIPSTFFADLQGGSATFALTLSGPGLGILGTTLDNGAGLDFSSLDIASQPSTGPTPELSTGLLLCTGLLGLALARTLLKHS
jgi:hypothetical protein